MREMGEFCEMRDFCQMGEFCQMGDFCQMGEFWLNTRLFVQQNETIWKIERKRLKRLSAYKRDQFTDKNEHKVHDWKEVKRLNNNLITYLTT